MEVGEGVDHAVHVLPPVVAPDVHAIRAAEPEPLRHVHVGRIALFDEAALAVVDVAVHADDLLRRHTGEADRVLPRRLADGEQPVVAAHEAKGVEVRQPGLVLGEIPFRIDVRDQVIDDAQAVRLVEPQPVRIQVVAAAAVQGQEKAGGEEHVDPPLLPPIDLLLEDPGAVPLELLRTGRPRQAVVPQEQVPLAGMIDADLADEALTVGGNPPIAVVLGDTQVDEERAGSGPGHEAGHAVRRRWAASSTWWSASASSASRR